jgi:hypothetical protein
MAFNVAEFRANMVGDGARPNLFAVTLVFPTFVTGGSAAGQKTTFMAKAAQLPGSTVGVVSNIYYFGREVKFAGNRSFPNWTLTIINDEDFIVRNALERWLNTINSHEGNIRNSVALTPSSYAVDALVTQYGKTGDILKTYKFVGLFPEDLNPIDVDWMTNDQIEEFQMTFAYQYWVADTTT